MTNGILMKLKSIAECSHWSILQYFWPALSDIRSWKPIFGVHFEWLLKTGFTVVIFVPYGACKTSLTPIWYMYFPSLQRLISELLVYQRLWCICGSSVNIFKHYSLKLQDQTGLIDVLNSFGTCFTVKPVFCGHSKWRPKIGFQDRLPNAGQNIAECSKRAFCNTFDLH